MKHISDRLNEANDQMTDLFFARQKSVDHEKKCRFIDNMFAASTVTLLLGVSLVDETAPRSPGNIGLISGAAAASAYCLVKLFQQNKPALSSRECDLKMYEITQEFPKNYEEDIHIYPDTPARWEEKNRKNAKKIKHSY